MSTLYLQEFSSEFSSALPTGWNNVAGTTDLVSDKLRTLTAATGYATAGVYFNGIVIPQDFDLYCNATITTVTASEGYAGVNVRAASTSFNHIQQYSSWNVRFFVGTNEGKAELYRINSAGVETELTADGPDIDFMQGSVLRFHIRCSGSTISLSYWKNAESEPGSFMMTYTDPTPPSGSMASLMIRNGSATTADDWRWDDFLITVESGAGPGHRPGRRRMGG